MGGHLKPIQELPRMPDRIRINDELLSRNMQAFLRSPGGRSVLETFDMSLGMCLAAGVFLGCMGLCMVPTIIWTLAGLQTLWAVARLQFLEPMYDNAAKHPERLVPLIAHLVIVGPDQKHALALGSFLPSQRYSVDWLAQLARWFGEVYVGKAADLENHAELYTLLHDDTYHPDRRRRVPERYAGGHELYLLDVEVNPREAQVSPFGTPLFAFAAEPGEKGEIAALPWFVVKDAVHF